MIVIANYKIHELDFAQYQPLRCSSRCPLYQNRRHVRRAGPRSALLCRGTDLQVPLKINQNTCLGHDNQ
jgi:hypothetical protein